MKTQVRAAFATVACAAALFSVSAAGASGAPAAANAPAPSQAAAVRASSAKLKSDRVLLAMLSAPTRGSYSRFRLNDDPDPSTCLSEGETCDTGNSVACCSNYCAPDDSGGGHCTGR